MTLAEEYQALVPRLERLEEEVVFGVRTALTATELKTHSLTSRVKTLDSLSTKAVTKGYDSPLTQAPDLVGARLVCLFLADLDIVCDQVHDLFEVLEDDDKVQPAAVAEFGYMSRHLVCRLSAKHSGPRYDGLADLRFEIQVRTILMDAWASVSHHLAYKGVASVPESLQRDFAALSGLFYVADRQFEQLAASAHSNQQADRSAPARNLAFLALDRDSLSGWLADTFGDRGDPDDSAVSAVAEELAWLGYTTIGRVATDISFALPAALAYEQRFPPGNAARYAAVGIVRMAMGILFPKYSGRFGLDPNLDTFFLEHPEFLAIRRHE